MKFKNLDDIAKHYTSKVNSGDISTLKSLKTSSGENALEATERELKSSCIDVIRFLSSKVKYYADQNSGYDNKTLNMHLENIQYEIRKDDGKISARVFWDEMQDTIINDYFIRAANDVKNNPQFNNVSIQ